MGGGRPKAIDVDLPVFDLLPTASGLQPYSTRICQMNPAGTACDLRHTLEAHGYFAHPCHADRGTHAWVFVITIQSINRVITHPRF